MEATSSTSKSGFSVFWLQIWLHVVPALKSGSSHQSVSECCRSEKETDGAISLMTPDAHDCVSPCLSGVHKVIK